MAYSFNTSLFEERTTTPINGATTAIEGYLGSCNTILKELSNGQTWRGGSSAQHLEKLTSLCNEYQNMYVTFVEAFNKFIRTIENDANDMLSNANIYGGAVNLSFSALKVPNFNNFVFNASNVAGDPYGDKDTILSKIESFMACLEDIKAEYDKIPGLFSDGYGRDKAIDLTDYGYNMSKDIEELTGIIDSLGLYSKDALNTQLQNIKNVGL